MRPTGILRLLTLLLPLAGCEGATDPVPAELVGTYALVAVNGRALPAPITATSTQTVTAQRGHIILREDGDFFQIVESTVTTGPGTGQSARATEEGSFEVSGSEIEFRPRLRSAYRGRVAGNRITTTLTGGGTTVTFDWQK